MTFLLQALMLRRAFTAVYPLGRRLGAWRGATPIPPAKPPPASQLDPDIRSRIRNSILTLDGRSLNTVDAAAAGANLGIRVTIEAKNWKRINGACVPETWVPVLSD